MDKKELLEAIEQELEDRSVSDERDGLIELRLLVSAELPLSYQQYEWLSYLCANSREAKIREELE